MYQLRCRKGIQENRPRWQRQSSVAREGTGRFTTAVKHRSPRAWKQFILPCSSLKQYKHRYQMHPMLTTAETSIPSLGWKLMDKRSAQFP